MSNVTRDRKNYTQLREAGWRACIIWECAIRAKSTGEKHVAIQKLITWLNNGGDFTEIQNSLK